MKLVRSARSLIAPVAIVVILVDQITKTLAENNLKTHSIHLLGPLSLQLIYNSGIAFSIGSGNAALATVIEIVVILGLIYYTRRINSRTLAVGFGLVIGGALGNICDRIFRHNNGAVIDFIHTGFWPTFNLADSAVVIGIVVILLGSRSRTQD
ncbi:MAG: signal peptidase II [Actinobacteria bacterium]|jgi:signal peptidase II|nr:signal peptidase II [Actinomycetota bacterium]